MRVVPNLYPAFPHQEVVVHAPEHVRSLAQLRDEQVDLVAEAWESRFAAARAAGAGYVHALVNEGRAAGASLAHSHSQLVWMEAPPPALLAEDPSAIPELLTREELLVAELGDARAVGHPAGRAPYELLIAASDPEPPLATLLRLLAECVRRLRAVEGAVPWNAWLHAGPHRHLELVPRLSVFAGIELGAGIWVNAVAPEDAAAALRGAAG